MSHPAEVIPLLEPPIGRAPDAERVRRRLLEARLVCLTGPVGVGKSHLAQAVAGALRARFPQGALWCDATVATSREELEALLEALCAPLGEVLLVLDGIDGCAEAARCVLPRWLARHAQRRALVTSRERTAIDGEAVVPLEPLAHADAVALFLRDARALNDRFAPTERELRAVDEIVRFVDGLPLAIRLCAAETLVLRPEALLAHLRSADARLDARAQGGSLRQAVASAFALLPDDVKPVLVACSIFAGTFSLAAAVEVAGASLPSLQALCERSFLRAVDDGAERRYRLYRPLADFASRLGIDDAVRERHRACYRRRLEAGEDPGEVRRNLLVSAAHDVDAGQLDRALDTLVAVTPLVLRQGPVGATLALLERASLASSSPEVGYAAGRLALLDGQLSRAAALLEEAERQAGEEDGLGPALLVERANVARQQGRASEASARYADALSHPHVPAAVAARAKELFAGHLFEQREADAARARYDEARAAYAALRDEAGLARVQHALGVLEQEDGNLAVALAHFREVEARHLSLGDERFAAIARFDEGALLLESGEPGAARRVLEDAVGRLEVVGDRRQAALGRALLGVCAAHLGGRQEAEARLEEALLEAEAMGDPAFLAAIGVHQGHLEAPAAALARLPATTGSDEERYAARLLERCARAAADALWVSRDGAFLEDASGTRTPLKSKAGRRILLALLEVRAEGGDGVLSPQELFRHGWPGERALDDAARNRLQVALSQLRKAGLAARLVREEGGYRLAGSVRVKST